MNYLNLTPGFEPLHPSSIEFKLITFSGGEPHITLNRNQLRNIGHWTITHRINSCNDLGVLAVAVDALRRLASPLSLDLYIPYFPGARQDRVANPGEALTVKVYADMINAMGFSNVTIFDPHSDVTPALIDRCEIITNHGFVKACLNQIYDNDSKACEDGSYIISPDAGANKKAYELMKELDHPHLIKCDKIRNTKTGELTGFTVYADDLKGKDCIIVDDICDGGGTFVGLAKELKKKGTGDLYLIVSHGIFSKGFYDLENQFKEIYTTDSFNSAEVLDELQASNSVLKQIKLSDP